MEWGDNRDMQQNERTAAVVTIDELALDKECIRLPSDYLKYAHRAADAKRGVDILKSGLDALQAELSNKIRKRPQRYGLEKITEASLNAAVVLQPEYQERSAALVEARHGQEIAQAVVWALECKKRSLTLLVELHGMGYFANPKISERGRDAVEQMIKKHVRRPIRED
jgi:hypothetical protein